MVTIPVPLTIHVRRAMDSHIVSQIDNITDAVVPPGSQNSIDDIRDPNFPEEPPIPLPNYCLNQLNQAADNSDKDSIQVADDSEKESILSSDDSDEESTSKSRKWGKDIGLLSRTSNIAPAVSYTTTPNQSSSTSVNDVTNMNNQSLLDTESICQINTTLTESQTEIPIDLTNQASSLKTKNHRYHNSKRSDAQKKSDKEKREKERIDFAVKCTFEYVEYDNTGHVESIGGLPIRNWTHSMLGAFLKRNNVQIGTQRSKDYIIKLITERNGLQQVNDAVVDNAPSKVRGVQGVKKYATFFRVINTLFHPQNKTYYIQTGHQLTRHELDGRSKHLEQWNLIYLKYDSENDPNIEIIVDATTDTHLMSYTNQIPRDGTTRDYDKISLQHFINLEKYIINKYRDCLANYRKSGQNMPFSNFDGKLSWVYYLHLRILETGCDHISKRVCPELPETIFQSSQSSITNNCSSQNEAVSSPSNVSDITGTSDSAKKRKRKSSATFDAESLAKSLFGQMNTATATSAASTATPQDYYNACDQIEKFETEILEVDLKLSHKRDSNDIENTILSNKKRNLEKKLVFARRHLEKLSNKLGLEG